MRRRNRQILQYFEVLKYLSEIFFGEKMINIKNRFLAGFWLAKML